MPVFNLTIPDTSPLIVYAGGYWGDSSHTDPEWNGYINGTFHLTKDNGATASLIFNGSAVYVFGAKRTNHGQYMATLDGSSTVASGFSPSDVFNQLLYIQTDLETKQHQLVLTNQWAGSIETFFDVDYMYVTSGDGNPNTASVDVVLDDGHQNITYSAGWDSSPNAFVQFYFNQTMHRTQTQGAAASVVFYGNAITVYGATSTNHGTFSISLDGVPISSNLNGSAPASRTQNMLYYSGGLSTSLHSLTMANTDTTGLFFDLDKVVVSTWSADSTSPPPAASPPNDPATARGTATSLPNDATSGAAPGRAATRSVAMFIVPRPVCSSLRLLDRSSGVNTAAVIGGVVPSVAVLALFIMGVFLLVRRRRAHTRHHEANSHPADLEVQPFVVEPWTSAQGSATLAHGTGQSQTACSASFTTVNGISNLTNSGTSTPLIEMENPHRDFPPPAYDEATA